MSEYESLRTDIDGLASSMENYARAVSVFTEAATSEIKRLWADNAELRDELHAVANRLENLTRSVVTAPAEVAERGFIRLAGDLDGIMSETPKINDGQPLSIMLDGKETLLCPDERGNTYITSADGTAAVHVEPGKHWVYITESA